MRYRVREWRGREGWVQGTGLERDGYEGQG